MPVRLIHGKAMPQSAERSLSILIVEFANGQSSTCNENAMISVNWRSLRAA
jgi:altronate dehydratase